MELDIKLSKQEIANDVAAELNLIGRTLELSANTDDKAAENLRELGNLIRTPDDNETKPIVARAMTEGWNAVKEACQRFLAFGRTSDDNRLESITIPESVDYLIDVILAFTTYNSGYDTGMLISLQDNTTYKFKFDFSEITAAAGKYDVILGSTLLATVDINPGTVQFNYPAKEPVSGSLKFVKHDGESQDIVFAQGTAALSVTYSYNKFDVYNLQLVMKDNFNVSMTSNITGHAHRLIVDTVMAAVLKNQKQDDYAKYLATAEVAAKKLTRSLQACNSFGRVQHDWM